MQEILSFIGPILIVGLSWGSLYGLVGLGFTVIINATQIPNFSQGDFSMFGVAIAWYFITILGFPLWIGITLAVVSGALIGLGVGKVIILPLLRENAPLYIQVLGTLAVGMIISGSVGAYTDFYWMPIEHFISFDPWHIMGVAIDTQGALIITTTVVLVIGYWIFLNKTLVGTALRATGFNREVAIHLGIRTTKMAGLSCMIGGVVSAIAGVLCAPLISFNALAALPLAVNGFIALIIGGWGNPYSAVLGGITIGMIRAFLTGYFTSAHCELATFIFLIIVLTIRPQGLFPHFMMEKERKKLIR
jgi:branched-chain amino acid transport system permease protein